MPLPEDACPGTLVRLTALDVVSVSRHRAQPKALHAGEVVAVPVEDIVVGNAKQGFSRLCRRVTKLIQASPGAPIVWLRELRMNNDEQRAGGVSQGAQVQPVEVAPEPLARGAHG